MSNKTKRTLMIMKRLYKDGNKTVYSLSDKNGYIKAKVANKGKLDIGQVIEIEDNNEYVVDVSNYKIITDYKLEDYLPTSKMPIEDIMDEIEEISKKYITSPQAVKLNDYFFKDEEFLAKFKKCIGGVSMHHNYIGGLAEHTLHVMHLTQIFCEIYHCRRPEIAILSAKLHDIGKIHELFYEGPFKYTLEGELEGHIVIGVQMIDRALRECGNVFSEDFIRRVKGCITQHHGKIEYGSPKAANMEESFILNYADSIDATLNKINQLKESCEKDNWSEYERKLDTRLYL
ncbi:HD domain-containing protein [Clostridium sp. CCUG 7971]|uniref:HD domain-containing protein n=1 Tax=Clostridium sp. CCUG 7971 TaxID=2811414 RepID=UPI001ABA6CE3|nr:HD domain-containing protein [Clostridium sp. CCUG 7971]MBO3444593.1 HD domain-containing protein [Clostridium sp. CCUG 7971]